MKLVGIDCFSLKASTAGVDIGLNYCGYSVPAESALVHLCGYSRSSFRQSLHVVRFATEQNGLCGGIFQSGAPGPDLSNIHSFVLLVVLDLYLVSEKVD